MTTDFAERLALATSALIVLAEGRFLEDGDTAAVARSYSVGEGDRITLEVELDEWVRTEGSDLRPPGEV